jgi:hypothetical protein
MLAHCFFSYLKLTNIQNAHHQPQCIVDNNVQQNGVLLTELLVVFQQRQFQFCASGPAVFLIFWCTQCSLNHTTCKRLVVLSQEIGVDTARSSLPCQSSHSAQCDEHWFYRHQTHENIAIWTSLRLCEDV